MDSIRSIQQAAIKDISQRCQERMRSSRKLTYQEVIVQAVQSELYSTHELSGDK